MQDDSTNFVKYFTDNEVLEKLGAGEYQPESRREAVAKVADTSLQAPESGLPPIVSGADFPPIWELESRPFLIDGMFQRSDTILVTSPAKNGKSLMWGNIGVCCATGTPFLGRETTQSNVLILDLELRRDVAMERLIKIANARGFDKVPPNLYLWSLARHTYNLDTIIEVLHARLEQLPPMDLVIVDPIYVLDRGDSFDENNAHCVTRLITALEQLTTEQDSALGLVHHVRKGNVNNADSMDRASGSSAFSRYPSVIMNISKHEIQDCSIIEFTTRNFKTPKPLCYQLDAPLVKERPDLDPTKYRRYGDQGKSECFGADDVMNQLPNHAISKQEWFARCRSAGIEESVFLNHFDTLLSSGLVLTKGDEFMRNMGAGV
jgi:hypothetical protein